MGVSVSSGSLLEWEREPWLWKTRLGSVFRRRVRFWTVFFRGLIARPAGLWRGKRGWIVSGKCRAS